MTQKGFDGSQHGAVAPGMLDAVEVPTLDSDALSAELTVDHSMKPF